MFEVNGVQIDVTGIELLETLRDQLQLNNINLLKDIRPNVNDIQFTCISHGNGQERKPSCGISLVNKWRGGKMIKAGTVHCFACGYTAFLDTFISNCFGKYDGGLFGNRWLRKNFGGTTYANRPKLNLNLTRDKSIDKEVKYIDDKELDEYRYTHPYMYKRLLTDDVIELFDIGFDKETNCITMPVHDLDGKTVFIQRRSVNGKYHHYDRGVDKTNYVYGAYECIKYYKNSGSVVICESILNALTFWTVDIPAVALMGLGGGNQYNILKKLPFKSYVIAMDPDIRGDKGRENLIQKLKNSKILYDFIYPYDLDINDLGKKDINLIKYFKKELI